MRTMQHCVIAMLIVFVTTVLAIPRTLADTASEPITITVTDKKSNTTKTFIFSSVAIDNLKLLRRVVADMGLSRYTETLQSIMLVETRAGTGGSVGLPTAHWTRRSYGLMQITVPTARVMLHRYPDVAKKYFGDRPIREVTNQELIEFLIKNKEANITLGALVYQLYLQMTHNEWARAVAGYNMGIANALRRPEAIEAKYVSDVRWFVPFTAALNRKLKKLEEVEQKEQAEGHHIIRMGL